MFQTITIISKDLLGSFVNSAIYIVYEHYKQMREVCRDQVEGFKNKNLLDVLVIK